MLTHVTRYDIQEIHLSPQVPVNFPHTYKEVKNIRQRLPRAEINLVLGTPQD